MRVGFTGTREGMTDAQRLVFESRFRATGATEFHHGACGGADAEAALWIALARVPQPEGGGTQPLIRQLRPWCKLHAHPSALPGTIHAPSCALSDYRHPPRPALGRNKDIVEATETLMACPKGGEVIRSGTWHTIRYARRLKRKVVICWPDGQVTEEN